MTAPDKIWIVGDSYENWNASMEWRGAKATVLGGKWDTEYTRSDLIPAMLTEARAEGRREGLREALNIIGQYDEESTCPTCTDVCAINEAVTAILDAEPTTQPKPDEVREAAKVLLDLLATPSELAPISTTKIEEVWAETLNESGFSAVNGFLRALAEGDSHE